MIYANTNLSRGRILRTWRQVLRLSSNKVREMHSTGHKLEFYRAPALHNRPLVFQQDSQVEDDQLHLKWQALVQQGVAKVVDSTTPGFYSRSFVIKKKQRGEYRLISDLRRLNTFILKRHIKIRGLKHCLSNLQRRDWLLSVDIKDGYFNVKVDPQYTKFLRFYHRGIAYELQYLPMGLVTSMEAFRMWLRPTLEVIRTLMPKVYTFAYVDDILFKIPHCHFPQAQRTALQLQWILQVLNIPLKPAKSTWVPSRELEHLGFIISTRDCHCWVPPKKSKEIIKQIKKTLTRDHNHTLQLRHLASCLGKLMALLPVVPDARLHSRALYDLQADVVRELGWAAQRRIRLSLSHKTELQWWHTYLQAKRFTPFDAHFRTHELSLMSTDASDRAIAACLISNPKHPTYQRWLSRRENRALSINQKEMMAVLEGVRHFSQQVRGTMLNIRSDSATVVHCVSRWGSKSHSLNAMLQELHEWARETDTLITATYIPTHSNHIADKLSRGKGLTPDDHAETTLLVEGIEATSRSVRWRLQPHALKCIRTHFRCRPRLWAKAAGPVFTHDLHRRSTLMLPKLNDTPNHLKALENTRTDTIAIIPLWPSAPFFNQVARLSTSLPLILPPEALQPLSQQKKSNVRWAWISVRLSGSKRKRKAFRRRLHTGTRRRTHAAFMPGHGAASPALRERALDYCRRFAGIVLKTKY